MKTPAVGIDLGTTNSRVAVFQEGRVEVIANSQTSTAIPSCVAFTDTGLLIGEEAKYQVWLNPRNTLLGTKRLLGRRFSDTSVQEDLKQWPFTVLNQSGSPQLEVEFRGVRRQFAPEEVTALLLTNLKETAESFLGVPVRDAVISVPACFSDSQRQATKDAATIAGLNVLGLINEPTSAALAYGMDKNLRETRNVLVFALGGGTCEASVLTVCDGSVEVRSSTGDSHLGGEDLDSRLLRHLVDEFSTRFEKDLRASPQALRRLRTACETAKHELSTCMETRVDIEAVFEGENFHSTISRSTLEQLCSDLLLAMLEHVRRALVEAKMDKADIHDVVLVGGTSRIPKLQKILSEYFNGKRLCCSVNPEEAVVSGAAIHAARLGGEPNSQVREMQVTEVAPLSLSVEAHGVMTRLLERSSPLPCRRTLTVQTRVDNQTSLTVHVLEGAKELLGKVEVCGIPPAPRGSPVHLNFELDSSGLLTVGAQDERLTTRAITGRLSDLELQELTCRLETLRVEETLDKLRLAARDKLENLVFELRAAVRDRASRLTQGDKDYAEGLVSAELAWLDSNPLPETAEAEERMGELQRRTEALMWRVRLAGRPGPAGRPPPGHPPSCARQHGQQEQEQQEQEQPLDYSRVEPQVLEEMVD